MPSTAILPTISKRDALNARLAQMKTERQSHEPTWRDIGDYIAPYDHEFNATSTNQGERRDSQIINSTPEQALDIGVSGLFNGLCDPTEEWMAIEAEDPELAGLHNVEVYCAEVTRRYLAELAKSNYYTVAPEDFAAILAFGTCASMQLEYFGESCFWFGALPPGSYYAACSAWWEVDQLGRQWEMTARQMAQQFPEENLSQRVRDALANNRGEAKFQVTHLIYPNPDYREGALDKKFKAFASCYYEATSDDPNRMLLEEGFDQFPARVARWKTRGNGVWGYGPGHRVIGDAKALQAYEYDIAMAVELGINPPTITPPGVNLQATALLPGARSQAADSVGAQGVKPIFEVDFDVAKAQQRVDMIENRIEEGFYNNIFLMISNDQGGKMTAREVMERAREKRLALTPILRLEHEYLTPNVAWGVGIMGRRGKLPPPPEELRGAKLKIVYKSALSQAAHMEKASAMEATIGFGASLMPVDPEIMDNYDLDEAARIHARNNNAPPKIMRDPKAVEKIRAARQQRAAQQAQMQQVADGAKAAKDLSQAKTDEPSALTAVMNAAQQQQ